MESIGHETESVELHGEKTVKVNFRFLGQNPLSLNIESLLNDTRRVSHSATTFLEDQEIISSSTVTAPPPARTKPCTSASDELSVSRHGEVKLPVSAQRRRRGRARIDRCPFHLVRVFHTQAILAPSISVPQEPSLRSLAQLSISPKTCPSRLQPLIAPNNYGAVDARKIFRSALPEDENVPFLQSLKIRTVVTLTDSRPTGEFHSWLKASGIAHHQIDLGKNKAGHPGISMEAMCEALLVVMNSNNWPLHIHCNQGKHRTGCVVACFRKIQNMEFRGQGRKRTKMDKIIGEYITYAGRKARDADIEFIKTFNPAVVFAYAMRRGLFRDLLWMRLVQSEIRPPVVSNMKLLAMVLLLPSNKWDELKEVPRPMVKELERAACALEYESLPPLRTPATMGPCVS